MIPAENIFAVLAGLLAICAAAAALERTNIGKRLSGAGIVLAAAIAAGQFGILPRAAPLYGVIWTYLVPLAIALFLLKADLFKVITEGGRVLVAFLVGMAGTVAGTLLGVALVDLGTNEAAFAAVFSATYTGGSLNFVAVADAVGFDDSSALSAALAIDSILGVGFIVALNVLAGFAIFRRAFPGKMEDESTGGSVQGGKTHGATLSGYAAALALAAAIVAVSEGAASALGIEAYSLLFVTVAATGIATAGRTLLQRIEGEDVLAMLFMYLFFAIVGVGANIGEMLDAAPGLFVLVLSIFVVHLVFMAAAGRLLRLSHAELVTASLACIAGPPVAAAIAILFKWRSLVAPGILTGVLGYVLGNFVGVGIFSLLRVGGS